MPNQLGSERSSYGVRILEIDANDRIDRITHDVEQLVVSSTRIRAKRLVYSPETDLVLTARLGPAVGAIDAGYADPPGESRALALEG